MTALARNRLKNVHSYAVDARGGSVAQRRAATTALPTTMSWTRSHENLSVKKHRCLASERWPCWSVVSFLPMRGLTRPTDRFSDDVNGRASASVWQARSANPAHRRAIGAVETWVVKTAAERERREKGPIVLKANEDVQAQLKD